jgi:hypothetical protein
VVTRPLLTPVAQKLHRCERVLTSRTCVHSRTKLGIEIAAVREAFSNAYPGKEVPNKYANTPTDNKIWAGSLSSSSWWTVSASAAQLLC